MAFVGLLDMVSLADCISVSGVCSFAPVFGFGLI